MLERLFGWEMLRTVAMAVGAYATTAGVLVLLMVTVAGPFVYIGFIGLFAAGIIPAWLIAERLLTARS